MRPPIKVLTIVGTRPEAIKLFPLIHALEADARFTSRVCFTGQHREMVEDIFTLTGISADHDLELLSEGQSLDALTARALTAIGAVLDEETPDWVVVQGDTTSAMAGALAAHYRKMPICHVEAGLRSGNMHHPWPEEANRRIIGTLANLHCAPTQRAEHALLREGVDPAKVRVTGNTVIDALYWMRDRLQQEPELAATMAELEERFAGRKIIGVTAHRRENQGAPMVEIAKALAKLAERDDTAIIFPLHPNPEIRAIFRKHLSDLENIALTEPLGYPDFVRLMDVAALMLTDSGGVQEEAPAFGTPVLVMRETTERPEAVEAGGAAVAGTQCEQITSAADQRMGADSQKVLRSFGSPYGDGTAALMVADLLAGQTP